MNNQESSQSEIPPGRRDAIELAARLLRELAPGLDWRSESLARTPARFFHALSEMLEGYAIEPTSLLTTFDAEGYDQVVAVRDIDYVSLCEHHVLPFTGRAHVAYLPGARIVGLSKIPRIVHAVTRRLQVQERITLEIAAALREIEPRGIAVVVEGRHSCMSLRGAKSEGTMVTSVVEGVFRESASARAEVLKLLGRG